MGSADYAVNTPAVLPLNKVCPTLRLALAIVYPRHKMAMDISMEK